MNVIVQKGRSTALFGAAAVGEMEAVNRLLQHPDIDVNIHIKVDVNHHGRCYHDKDVTHCMEISAPGTH